MLIFVEDKIRQCTQMTNEVICKVKSTIDDLISKDEQVRTTMRVDNLNNDETLRLYYTRDL